MQALGVGNRGRIAWRYRLVKSFPRKRRNRGLNGFGWRGEWREGYKPDREWQFKTRTLITESAAPKTNRAERLLAVSPKGLSPPMAQRNASGGGGNLPLFSTDLRSSFPPACNPSSSSSRARPRVRCEVPSANTFLFAAAYLSGRVAGRRVGLLAL